MSTRQNISKDTSKTNENIVKCSQASRGVLLLDVTVLERILQNRLLDGGEYRANRIGVCCVRRLDQTIHWRVSGAWKQRRAGRTEGTRSVVPGSLA